MFFLVVFARRLQLSALPSLSLCSVVLAFSERTDAGANLSFRLDLMLVQKKRPGPIGILQSSVAATSFGIGHRFDRGDTHHQKLILASPLELIADIQAPSIPGPATT